MLFLAALLCGSLLPADDEPAGPWHEASLDNGIQLITLDAPLAEQQAFFTMLPLGLLDDEADKAQFAHLLEHLIVRSTDPELLEVDGVLLNGETTALAMRLETITDVANWKDAFNRHVAWLQAEDVDPEVLAREKVNIALEEQNTVPLGYTHKWALAAWNQVVRHGTSHVGLHGDVAGTSAEEARDYLRRRLRPGPQLVFVGVGPVSFEDILAEAQETMGALPGSTWAVSAPGLPVEAVRKVGDREATWDLDTRHYMEWYPVPAETVHDRILADALAFLISGKLQQRGALEAKGAQALAQADLVSPEGRWLLISASLPPGVSVADVREELDEVVGLLHGGREASLALQQLVIPLTQIPDFAALRLELGAHPAARWIEAQQMLFMLYAQLNMGLTRQELLEAYAYLDAGQVLAFADQVLAADKRSTLVLEPER